MLVEETTVPAAALPIAAFKDHLRLGTGFSEDTIQDSVLEGFLRAAVAAIEARTGKDAKDVEVAKEMDIDLNAYYAILQDASGSRLFSFDDIMEGDDSAIEMAAGELIGPCDGLQRDTFKAHLSRAIDSLPEREKLVLALYYDEELNLKEIGEVIGVSESRVSQIHSQAAMRLRARLSDWS